MKELERKLQDLQKRGFENVSIIQLQNWIADIKRENRLKRSKIKDK